MTFNDSNKIKLAVILTFIFILVSASNKLGIELLLKAIAFSIIVFLPILIILIKYSSKLNKVSSKTSNVIAMLLVPIGLIVWRWLHKVSPYYETFVALLVVYVLLTSVISNKSSDNN